MPRLKFIHQHDAMQCGVASLAMVCSILGRRLGMETISRHCHPTAEGVSLKGIADAATKIGLESSAVRVSIEELTLIGVPAILHWNQDHFVVLHRISRHGRRFHIADPAKGMKTVGTEEMKAHWINCRSNGQEKGVAMIFDPMPDFMSRTVEESNGDSESRRGLRFLMGYIMRYRRYFAQIAAGLLLGCVLQLAMPFLTQWIVDFGINHRDIGFIWLVLIGELMIAIGRTATSFIRSRLLLHISMRINLSLLSDFFIKLLRLPMGFFDTKLTGDLMQRMSDHNRVQQFLTQQTLGIIFTALSFIVFGVVLAVYDTKIFAVFVAASTVYGVWIALFLRKRKMLDYELFERQSINNNLTWQLVTSMQEIKLQNCEQRRRWEWEDVQADLFKVSISAMKLQQTQQAGSLLINEIKNIVITVMAASAVIDGTITLGVMLAIQYIVGQLNSPVEQLMGFIYSLQDVKISLERINEIHCGKNEEDTDATLYTDFKGEKSLTFANLAFKYDLHSPHLTLDGIDLYIPQGKVTAIVGASGSGKTTLIKLMLGYYAPFSGQLMLGQRQLREHSMRWWRQRCGTVMQDGIIFSESIARNIAVDDGPIDTGRLEKAARIACIHDYVMSLPLKYQTKVGRDGTGLSQGQKQRILIARAVYRDPDFIFLDEATNSLDADNERAIVENLATFFHGRTVVIVAHRLSTVRHADKIVVLDQGRIVETGTHSELTALRGTYYNLVKNQLELGN